MNELLEKTDPGSNPGGPAPQPAPGGLPQKPPGVPPVGNAATPPLPAVQIGKPGYVFKLPADTQPGQDERREHERIRKADKRAAHKTTEPPPLAPATAVDPLQTPGGEQMPGGVPPPGAVVVETFVPWLAADVSDFTDELVELTETKRVADFVTIAREANMPAKFITAVEERSHYPKQSKAALKRCIADCAAKWLNKSGVSSKSKEEVKLLFVMVTIKLQGMRLKKDLVAMIEADKAERAKRETPKPTTPAKPAPLEIDREKFMAL